MSDEGSDSHDWQNTQSFSYLKTCSFPIIRDDTLLVAIICIPVAFKTTPKPDWTTEYAKHEKPTNRCQVWQAWQQYRGAPRLDRVPIRDLRRLLWQQGRHRAAEQRSASLLLSASSYTCSSWLYKGSQRAKYRHLHCPLHRHSDFQIDQVAATSQRTGSCSGPQQDPTWFLETCADTQTSEWASSVLSLSMDVQTTSALLKGQVHPRVLQSLMWWHICKGV